jgi:hypothetical protein
MFEIIDSSKNRILQIAENDVSDKLDYFQAKKECEELGEGWRLPTYTDLKLMYSQLYKKGKRNFQAGRWYWFNYIELEGQTENGTIQWYFIPGGEDKDAQVWGHGLNSWRFKLSARAVRDKSL